MTDRTHLHALELRLSNERMHRAAARTDSERELRSVWISQLQREIAGERAFLGLLPEEKLPEMTLDEILAELES